MLVRKKKYDAVKADMDVVIANNGHLVQDILKLENELKKKESEICRLNERIRNLQKKPFKK